MDERLRGGRQAAWLDGPGFAEKADTTRFAAECGGKVLRFAEITPAMVDLSGGAQHDTRMCGPSNS